MARRQRERQTGVSANANSDTPICSHFSRLSKRQHPRLQTMATRFAAANDWATEGTVTHVHPQSACADAGRSYLGRDPLIRPPPTPARLAKFRHAGDIKGLSFDVKAPVGQQQRYIHAQRATPAFATGPASAPDRRSPGFALRSCCPMWTPGKRLWLSALVFML